MSDPPDADTRPFRLVVEYDGTAYAGWQRQANAPTVQQALEEALERVAGHPVRCPGAGRTDAGVHARGQVARVDVSAPRVDAEALRRGGNTYLPEDVRIVSAEPCDEAFDPRRDARSRWYRYSILARPSPPAIGRQGLLHVPQPMDWTAVESALERLGGEHDFSAFRSSACTATRTRLTVTRAQHVDDHPEHHLDFECRSFLHNMVRLMVGLLVEIGRGKHPPDAVTKMLESGDRTTRFRTAPPHGLTLMRVDYCSDDPETRHAQSV